MKKLVIKKILSLTLVLVMAISTVPFYAFAAKTVSVLDGNVSITDSLGKGSVSSGTVTITASGNLFSKATNNITITNETADKAKLTFDYATSSANSFKIAGATANASGTYSSILEAGSSVSITLVSNSGLSGTTATLTLQNFSLVTISDNSNVTFMYDNSLGSITVGGSKVENNSTQAVNGSTGVELVATAKSGVTFLGWIDASGMILSTAATYTLIPATNMTVKAAFAENGGTPWFAVGTATQKSQGTGLLGLGKLYYYQVGKSYLFDDLNAAANYASVNSTKALVLMNNAILPAGEYTIPAGVTLLIPFDTANTLYTTQAQSVEAVKMEDYKTPTVYRTLNMASGANITINGAVSLSAKHHYANGSKVDGGSPAGALSFINMEENSSITVNNGGALYVYGFITGLGSVVANSGANVYENFQIMDFRGGTQSTDMDNGVFPLSQYYLQNIEVPLTLYSGAKEYAYTTIYMSKTDFGSAVAFISNSNAMFNLTSGYVVKDYDENTDRLVIKAYGDVKVSAIEMEVGTSDINSKDYELPINGNMTVEVVSGNIEINQDIAFLPGSEIIIGENAKCTLGSGNNMYVYDVDNWGNYVGTGDSYGKFKAVTYAPGRKYTRTEADIVDAKVVVYGTVDATKGYIYTANGDADISGSGTVKIKHGTQTVTHQYNQGTAKYSEIPLSLPNKDGWEITHNTSGGSETKDATCTESGFNKVYCTCGHVAEETVIDALGHTEVVDEAVEPTATQTGLTEGKHCSICGEVLVEQQVVSPYGDVNNDFVIDEVDYLYIVDIYIGKVKVDDKAECCDINRDGKFDIRDVIAINELINT